MIDPDQQTPDSHRRTDPAAVRVILVGPMGSGKSTVGKDLAQVLNTRHVDADDLFVEAHGSIPEYFTAHGEAGFREAEETVVAQALANPDYGVLSLGGGAVITAGTRQRLTATDSLLVVYLQVTTEEALNRLGAHGAGRPMLAGDPAANWERIATEREAFYREVADVRLATSGLSPREISETILSHIPEPLHQKERHGGS